jgi:hypothetical protein
MHLPSLRHCSNIMMCIVEPATSGVEGIDHAIVISGHPVLAQCLDNLKRQATSNLRTMCTPYYCPYKSPCSSTMVLIEGKAWLCFFFAATVSVSPTMSRVLVELPSTETCKR